MSKSCQTTGFMIAIVCAKYAIPGIPNLLKIEPGKVLCKNI